MSFLQLMCLANVSKDAKKRTVLMHCCMLQTLMTQLAQHTLKGRSLASRKDTGAATPPGVQGAASALLHALFLSSIPMYVLQILSICDCWSLRQISDAV